MSTQNNILVIKLGALGDFIQALGPMAAIRKHHPNAHITLLTTNPFKKFAADCGYFDDVWIDQKPKFYNLAGWLSLRKKLNAAAFDRVYDLQNNDRTSFYFSLLKHKPEWVGIAKGASHRNVSPQRTAGHAFDGHVQTLALAGINNVGIDDLKWLNGDISAFKLKKPYALLVPGSAPQHPEKRWPAEHYGGLAQVLIEQGIQPLIIGAQSEFEIAKQIQDICADVENLVEKTSFAQIVTLAKSASLAVGNDTGPMHLIGASGCPSLVLFSNRSDPVRHAPKGKSVHFLQEKNLNLLSVQSVEDKLSNLGLFST